MIAISSFRPMGEHQEYDHNQLAAKQSWDTVFDKVIYLNQPELKLSTPSTVFFPTTDSHPTIKALLEKAACQPGWSALINADIVIGPKLKQAERLLTLNGAKAAMSRRYEFDPAIGITSAKRLPTDLGLDFFAAMPMVWRKAAEAIHPAFRIGHQQWDTWLMGFLNATCGRFFFDITNHRCVFHPRHEGRRFVYSVAEQINQQDKYFGCVCWPMKLIAST